MAAGTAVATGAFTITSNKGVSSITIGGTTLDEADIKEMLGGKFPGPITAAHGELIITGFTKTADGYQVEYEYRLTEAVQHGADDLGTPGIDEGAALDVELDVSVTSSTGKSESNTITVTVIDDVPEFISSDDIHTNNNKAEFSGEIEFSKGADGDNFKLEITSISNLPKDWKFTLSPDGKIATVYHKDDNKGENPLFKITLQPDGKYTVEQLVVLDDDLHAIQLKPGNYESYADGKGAKIGNLIISAYVDGENSTVNISGKGMGVHNNHISKGEKLVFDFTKPVNDFTITVGRDNGTNPGVGTIIKVNGIQVEVPFVNGQWFISKDILDNFKDGIRTIELISNDAGHKYTVTAVEENASDKIFDVNVKGTDGDGDAFDGTFNVSNGPKPTDPTGPTDPADKAIPTPDIALTQVGEPKHVPGTEAETTIKKGDVSITFEDGQVTVSGMQQVNVTSASYNGGVGTTSHALVVSDDAFDHILGSGTATLTGTWNNTTNQPVDILVLPGSKDSYDLSNLVISNGIVSGTITVPGVAGGLTLAYFTGIVFADGQTLGSMNGSTVTTTEATPAYDLVTLDLDAWVAVPGDASDKLTSVTISGLGEATVVSVEYRGKTLVAGTDYTVKDGVLTLVKDGTLTQVVDDEHTKEFDMRDVSITLQVPEGHDPLDLQASVTASNDHGSNSAQNGLTVHVPHPDTGNGPGDEGTAPVVHAPDVDLNVTARVVETTTSAPKDPLEGTTAVNGGAKDPSGNGFNLDAAGNVVAVGFNVRVWGTYSTKGVDGTGKTPINDFDYNGDGKNDILVYKNGAFSEAQYGQNLIRIGYDTNGEANTNSAAADKTDLFLLHSSSGTWAGNGNVSDGDYGSWRGFNNFTGNNGTKGETAPDYAILIGDAASGAKINTPTANNAGSQTNVLESLNISTSTDKPVGQGMNKVEGVFAGGTLVVTADANRPADQQVTQQTKVPAATDVVSYDTVYDVVITATLADTDHSGEVLSKQLVLDGIPTGAKVIYNGTEVTVVDGKVTIEGALSADGQSVHANLTITGAKDADFTLTAHAQSADAKDALATADGHDASGVFAGTDAADSLLGSDNDDLLLGGAGNDHLAGGKGNDHLAGGKGDDHLVGGQGNDTLLGGEGDDTFVWLKGDEGTAKAPAVDTVQDFGNGKDVLDLSDLLQGENKSNLSDYLGASTETVNGKATTVLNISTSGHLATEGANQKIVLEGHNLDTSDQAKLVQDLISQGKLHVDL